MILPQRPAVVLLHCSASTSGQWQSLVERLQPRFRAHVVGHSYGGALALKVASLRPDLVHGVAVYEPVWWRSPRACPPWRVISRRSSENPFLAGEETVPAARTLAQRFRDVLPHATHEMLPGMGHMGPITHAAVLNARIEEFLRSAEEAVRSGHEALPPHVGVARIHPYSR
jgi:pimeloyl-ACP methyl ester carboxylesterase